jgi:RHS repeat-associated protein
MSSTKIVKGQGETVTQAERFLWQGECEVGSVDADSKFISLRVLGDGLGGEIGAAVVFEKNGEVFIPLHDLSGHVRACLNTAGEVVERLDYTAFGLKSRTSDITPWTFSSKRQDEGTGFIYFGRRYYEADTATWLTQDPLGHSAGPNLYAYVKNNPLTCIDLYGLIDELNGEHQYGRDNHTYVIYDKGIWRSDQVGQENVPHIELTQHTWNQVYGEFKDQNFSVLEHTNGIRTTCDTARQRAENMYSIAQSRCNDTMMSYNPTNGFVLDVVEAICNILGIETEVATTLTEELEFAVDCCKEHNVSMKVDFTSHSQGGAVNNNILSSKEFGDKGTYRDAIGKVATFGSVDFSPNGENYVQQGDFVPYLNPGNWGEFGSDNVHTFERNQDPIYDAHGFDGQGYQDALHDFVEHLDQVTVENR